MKAGFQIPSLNGLRAFAFACVFTAHAGLGNIVPGAFGVTVFFFLSGYLITTLMRIERKEAGRVSLRHFYLRRVLRILPPFYLLLVATVIAVIVGVVPGTFEWRAVAAQALHYGNYWIVHHGFGGLPAGTGVYWSLAVEEHFYLLFPGLYLLLTRFARDERRQALALLALCAVFLCWRVVLVKVLGASDDRTAIASDTRFDSLLFGCALALYENPALDPSALSERTWKFVLFPLGIAGLLAGFLIRNEVFRETFRYTLQGICLVPVFVCAIRYPRWYPMRFLNLRPVEFVGLLSYSLYLIHQVVIFALDHHFEGGVSPLVLGPLALAVAVLLATVMYYAIEKPCARLRRRLHA